MSKAIKGNTAPKVESSQGKRVLALSIMAAGIVGLLFIASNIMSNRQEMVEVIRLTQPVTAGQLITESIIESAQISKEDYETLGVVPIVNSEGKTEEKQVILQWSQRDEVINQYAANYIGPGRHLTSVDLTKELSVRNPWIQDMDPDEEIFTMSFDSNSVNARLLYPGTRLRARLVEQVPVDVAGKIRSEIAKAESKDVEHIVRDSTVIANGTTIDESEAKNDIQVAEIVIDEIIITDMTNSKGESIYDLYMSLLKLPITQRIDYLRTTLGENETANSWADRVTPTTITFILDKASASRLAEFEQGDGTIKYTILPDDPDTTDQANLMSQFVELSNQINTVIDEG